MQVLIELPGLIEHLFSDKVVVTPELKDIFSWETTPKIAEYLLGEINKETKSFFTAEEFDAWGNHLKNEFKIKGKPLFMGMRGVLTGEAHGPELKLEIPLTPIKVLKNRIKNTIEAVK